MKDVANDYRADLHMNANDSHDHFQKQPEKSPFSHMKANFE